eukprot:TRINITY_DN3621_c0_g1_i2.p1 TRINITY_DN3621_c0_g1~~TRINITY_DN3621_c0_g1_i2.p1  ORF type:complete len:158 (-),score=16.64 TRINITY_DN3621_c0_g1_i2:125-598(-)
MCFVQLVLHFGICFSHRAGWRDSSIGGVAYHWQIPPLVELLTTEHGKQDAAGTLRNLSYSGGHEAVIIQAGAVPPLVKLLTTGSAYGKRTAAGALCNLTRNLGNNVSTIVQAGAIPPYNLSLSGGHEAVIIPPLVELLTTGSAHGKTNTGWCRFLHW